MGNIENIIKTNERIKIVKYVYFIFSFLFILSLISTNAQSKTDSVIITNLDDNQFISPALTRNNSFVYDNFEFRLYSETKNVSYSIEIDYILIANGTIRDFPKIINWECEKDQINNIVIRIGSDYYNYSSIYVFTSSFSNGTPWDDEKKITMTEQAFNSYIYELKIKLFTADTVGWFMGLVLAQVYVRQYKSTKIEEIE